MIRADIYRTCRYKNEDYLFHCFEQWSNVIGESVMEILLREEDVGDAMRQKEDHL